MARISTAYAVLGPCVAIAAAVALTACSADDPAHRSFRPQVITASGVPYTGNGIAALDPQAIVTRTIKATSSAPTVHLTGSLTGVPVPQGAGTFRLDMVFTQFGAVGDITNGDVTSRLLRVEDQVWTAAPASFWAAAGASDDGKAYGGLYVKIPSADPRYAGFSDDTRIGFLLDRLLQTSATWRKGAVGTVDGVPSLELSGVGRDGHKASIWVATDGEPHLLRIAPTEGSYHGRIDFTGYEDRLAVQAPLPGEVLDNALLVLPSISPSALATSALPSGSPLTTPTVSSSPSTPSTSRSPSSSGSPSASSSASGSSSSSPSGGASASPLATSSHGSGGGSGGH